jgi:hypothetical protein
MLLRSCLHLGEVIGWVFSLRQIFLRKIGCCAGSDGSVRLFDPDEVVIAHIFNRVCRQCFRKKSSGTWHISECVPK